MTSLELSARVTSYHHPALAELTALGPVKISLVVPDQMPPRKKKSSKAAAGAQKKGPTDSGPNKSGGSVQDDHSDRGIETAKGGSHNDVVRLLLYSLCLL